MTIKSEVDFSEHGEAILVFTHICFAYNLHPHLEPVVTDNYKR